MINQVRPVNSYEEIDNEKRNMYAPVSFFNGSAGDVNVKFDGTSYGTVKAGETVSLPKFVAEYMIKRNLNYQITSGGDQEALDAIDGIRNELAGAELVASQQAKATEENVKQVKKRKAEILKNEAENAEAEVSLDEEPEDAII